MSAVGATGAVVDMVNVGAITLHATANASAQGGTGDSAHATALVYGINAFAGVSGAGDAAVNVTNDGVIAVAADAKAISSGPALAFAYAIYGIGASAAAASGDAAISVVNNGQLTLSAEADASGLHAATASAVAAGGIAAVANGFGAGDVSAEIVNTGSVLVEAGAHAVATTNALAIAIGVTGFYDIAHAMTGDAFAGVDNSGTLEVTAHATATALVAQGDCSRRRSLVRRRHLPVGSGRQRQLHSPCSTIRATFSSPPTPMRTVRSSPTPLPMAGRA